MSVVNRLYRTTKRMENLIGRTGKTLDNFFHNEYGRIKTRLVSLVPIIALSAGVATSGVVGLCCGNNGETPDNSRGSPTQQDDDTADDDAYPGDDDNDDTEDCVVPYSGMVIDRDTTLCPGEYDISFTTGASIIISSNIRLKCNQTKLIGNDTLLGIRVDSDGVTIEDCTLENFYTGVYADNSGNNLTISGVHINTVSNRFIEINSSNGSSNITLENLVLTNTLNSGILLQNVSESVISNIDYSNTQPVVESPIAVIFGSNIMIYNNKITSFGGRACNGIWIMDSTNTEVTNNYVQMTGTGEGSHTGNNNGLTYSFNTFIVESPAKIFDLTQTDNRVTAFGNKFYGGQVRDGGLGNLWCSEGIGNEYFDGASYSGPDPNGGTCP